ncbi:MAG TPA: hypothetical protein VFE37_13105 [Chloroflexota bacterium]|nr:hypothetical protein [Chloroflexota bacterium]
MSAGGVPQSLAIGSLIGRAWANYRARFGLYLGATAVAQLPTGVLTWLAGYGAAISLDAVLAATLPEVHDPTEAVAALLAIGADRVIGFWLLLIAATLLQVVGTVLSAGALAYLLTAELRPFAPPVAWPAGSGAGPGGLPVSPTLGASAGGRAIGAAYRAVLARLVPLFGAILLAGLIICAALLAVFAIWVVLVAAQYMLAPAGEAPPGWLTALLSLALIGLVCGAVVYAVYAFVRWALFIQAVVLEDAGPASALRRSAALLRGRWWQTALLLAVLAVAQGVVGSAASSLVGALAGGQANPATSMLLSGLGLLAANLLFFPLAANALTVLYLGLRAREAANPRESSRFLGPGPHLASKEQ